MGCYEPLVVSPRRVAAFFHSGFAYCLHRVLYVGSCMRYYLVRTEDPNMELSWAFGQRAEVGEEVVGQDLEMVGWWYLLGIYFTAV